MQPLVYNRRFLFMLLVVNEVSKGLCQNTLSSQGVWSSELTERLKTHSCLPGNLYKDITLLHGLKAGTFKELGRVKDVEVCMLQCCESHHRCELALFTDNLCYGITCYSPQHCKTVPALGKTHKMTAVFLRKESKVNTTSHLNQVENNQSNKSWKKGTTNLMFYPVDSSDNNELAFSVNLRKIARHYADSEQMKRVLRAKADEHLAELNFEEDGHQLKDEGEDVDKKRNRSSKLDQFFSRDQVSSTHKYEEPPQRIHGKTLRHQKNNDVNNLEWNSKLLKAAISSSSVALLIVVLVLLAMSRKRSLQTERTTK